MYNINYKENLRHKYIKICLENKDTPDYELKIIKYCHIPGIPKVSISENLDTPSIVYDISRYKSLSEISKTSKFEAMDILIFLNYLDIFLESIEEYLLPYEITALSPDLIFYDELKNKYIFTLIPGISHPIKKDLNKILYFFLENIDTDSNISILTAFKIYIMSKDADTRLRRLIVTAEKSIGSKSENEIDDKDIDNNSNDSDFKISYSNSEENNDYLEIDLDSNTYEVSKSLDNSDTPTTISCDEEDDKDDNNEIYDIHKQSIKDKILSKLSESKNIFKKEDKGNKKTIKNRLKDLSSSIIPYLLLIIIFPTLFYFVRGKSEFLKFMPFILIIEVAIILLYIFNLIINQIKKSDEDKNQNNSSK